MPRSRLAAVTLLALIGAAGSASAQPRPSPAPTQPPGTRPTQPPASPGTPLAPGAAPPTTPPKDIAVPNTASYPTEIGGRPLEKWIQDIDSTDPSVRERAIRVVVQFGPSARRAIPALVKQVKLLNDLSPQASAIIALSELVPLATPGQTDGYTTDAVNAIGGALLSTQAIIRYRAATALGWIGPPARTAIMPLIRQVDDRQSWEIRNSACFALGTAGRDEQGFPIVNALEALGKGVSDNTKDVRLTALQAVISLGPPASGGVPQLRAVLERRLRDERDKGVLIWVRVAIMRLDQSTITDKNLAVIAKDMKSSDPDLRIHAAKALGYVGVLAKSTVPELIDALKKSEDPGMLAQLCWTLGRMGQHAEKAIPSLKTLESHKDDVVKASAKAAVEEIEKAIDQAKKLPPLTPPKK